MNSGHQNEWRERHEENNTPILLRSVGKQINMGQNILLSEVFCLESMDSGFSYLKFDF